jgi:hypothetical protein
MKLSQSFTPGSFPASTKETETEKITTGKPLPSIPLDESTYGRTGNTEEGNSSGATKKSASTAEQLLSREERIRKNLLDNSERFRPLERTSASERVETSMNLAMHTIKHRKGLKAAPRTTQNSVMFLNGQPQTVDFTYQDGSIADLTPFLPPYKPSQVNGSGHCDVRAAQVWEYGGLKGAASFTKWEGSLPDLGFDAGEIIFSQDIVKKVERWPGLTPALVHCVQKNIRDRKEIPFLTLCKKIGAIDDKFVSPQEKMTFMQQLISNLIHRPKHGESRGGHYGSGPWSDPKSSLQEAARRDIARVKNGDNAADIAKFDDAYKLSEFVASEFGDCRPTNLLMAFALKAAGFGKDEDIQIVNVRCARMESLDDAKKLDDVQKQAAQMLKDIEALEEQIAEGKTQGKDTSTLEARKIEKEEQFYGAKQKGIKGLKAELAELTGDHTLIVMKWPPNTPETEQELRFMDFFYGELHGLPVNAAAKPLAEQERDSLRSNSLGKYKNRAFHAEKITDTQNGGIYHKAPFVQVRAFLPYPQVIGASPSYLVESKG